MPVCATTVSRPLCFPSTSSPCRMCCGCISCRRRRRGAGSTSSSPIASSACSQRPHTPHCSGCRPSPERARTTGTGCLTGPTADAGWRSLAPPPSSNRSGNRGLGYGTIAASSHLFPSSSVSTLLTSSSTSSSSSFACSRLSPLKAAFFQLHFSVSALNQPDFFHDLLEDFHTDDDILAFLLDATVHPDTSRTTRAPITHPPHQPRTLCQHHRRTHCALLTMLLPVSFLRPSLFADEHAARAILYSRDAYDHSHTQHTTRSPTQPHKAAVGHQMHHAPHFHPLAGADVLTSVYLVVLVSVLRSGDAVLASAAAAASSSRAQQSKGSFQTEDSGKGKQQQTQRMVEARREEDKADKEEEPSLNRSLDPTPQKAATAAAEGQKRRGNSRILSRSSSSFSRLPSSTLRRSRSDLSLDVVHLSADPRPSSASASAIRSRTDDDVGFVSPSARLRAALPSLPRYELFRASANWSKERMSDGRKKVLSWLADGGAIKALSSPSLLNHRLTLPLLWAALQSRYHEEADDGHAGSSGGGGGGGAIGAGGGGTGAGGGGLLHTVKQGRVRRSSSFDADPSGSNSLLSLFRQAGPASAQSASPASPLSPAASSAPTQAGPPPPLSSPFSSSAGSTSAPAASPSSSPFRSHLTTVTPTSTPSTSLYPERDVGGVHRSSPSAASSLSPSRPAHAAAATPPRVAPGAFQTPPSGKAMAKDSQYWDGALSSGGGSAGNSSNRYATVRLASSAHGSNHAGQRGTIAAAPPQRLSLFTSWHPLGIHSPLLLLFADAYLTLCAGCSVSTMSFAARGAGRRQSGPMAVPALSPSHWLHHYSSQCPHCRSAAKAFADVLSQAFASPSSGGSSGVPFSTLHVNALLSILVTPVESLLWMDNVSSPSHSVFAHAVVNAGVWPALFCQLQRADGFVQKRALKDINGVLVAANVG